MQRYILIYILFFVFFNANAQQKALLYKNYIDYYSENAKSTILTKDLKILKDGYYIFKGKKKYFTYLLKDMLWMDNYVLEYIPESETLYLVGKIRNSVKVEQWTLLRKGKSGLYEVYPQLNSGIDYGEYGEILFIKTTWNKFKGKFKIYNHKNYVNFMYKMNENTNTTNYKDQGTLTYYKKNDTIKYTRSKVVVYKTYVKEKQQSSENLNDYLKTEIVFSNSKESKNCIGRKKKTYNEYRLIINEKYKDGKLIKMSMERKYINKGKKYFKKHINNANFSSLLQRS